MRGAEWFQGHTVCVSATILDCIFLPHWASSRPLNDSQASLLRCLWLLFLLPSTDTSSLPLSPAPAWLHCNHRSSSPEVLVSQAFPAALSELCVPTQPLLCVSLRCVSFPASYLNSFMVFAILCVSAFLDSAPEGGNSLCSWPSMEDVQAVLIKQENECSCSCPPCPVLLAHRAESERCSQKEVCIVRAPGIRL